MHGSKVASQLSASLTVVVELYRIGWSVLILDVSAVIRHTSRAPVNRQFDNIGFVGDGYGAA
jgi:hypothetical protein